MKTKVIKREYARYMLAVAVGVQFLLIFLANYFKAEKLLDYDASMAVRHAVEMWRNKTIFLQDFGYTTSMEIDCAAFFAAPIYILTGNYGLGIAIAHLLLDSILAYGMYRLLKNMDVPFEFCAMGILLVFLPYRHGQLEWDNMLFLSVGQYEFRVTAAVLLFMILSYKGIFSKREWIWLAVCEFYIAFTALSAGSYLVIVLLVPILLYEIFNILTKERVDWKDRNLRIVILSMIVGLSAYALRAAMHITTNRSNMNIIQETEFTDNLLSCFTAIFALFGGVMPAGVEQPIISTSGIEYLSRFVITCIILGLGIATLRSYKKLEENRQVFITRFLCVFGINMLVLLYTNTTYGSLVFENRYHIIWCVLLILIDVMFLSKIWGQIGKWWKNTLICCMIIGFMVVEISGFTNIADSNWLNESIINLTLEKADEYGASDIVVVDEVTSRQMGAVDISKNVQFAVINEECASLGFITWGSSKNTHVDAQNVMAVRDEDLWKLSEDIRNSYTELATLNEWHVLYTEGYEWN